MEKVTKRVLSLLLFLFTTSLQAQSDVEMADGLRSEGKIYVVVGIILIVLAGLIIYLVMLDRKVKKLEDLLTGKNPQTK